VSLTSLMIAIGLASYLLGVLTVRPVTRRLHCELDAAHHDLRHDQLTGLRNRDGLTADHHQLTSDGHNLITLLADVDGFKTVNDTYGHHTGDELLTTVAARIGELAGLYHGAAARLGGDEFAVLIPATGHDPARIAEAFTVLIGQPITTNGPTLTVTASIGYTDTPGLTESLRAADIAMYHAKRSGTGQPSGYRLGMTVPATPPQQRRRLRGRGVTE
jgi:diguanylate cyclase (GGDEF)-like protein